MRLNTPDAQRILETASLPVPEHLYAGCGKAWVAVREGEIVGIAYMADFPGVELSSLGRKRRTRKALQLIRERESENFAEHRRASRERLAQIGEVMSGMCSGLEFFPNRAIDHARLVNLSRCGHTAGLEI